MKRLIPLCAMGTLFLLAMALDSFSAFIGPVTQEYQILNSHDIIHGIVREVRSEWGENHSIIYTYANIDVLEVLKGEPQDHVRIKIDGGTVDDTTLWVEDEAEFNEGMEVVIYTGLYENGDLGVFNGEHGLLAVENGVVEKLGMTLDQFRNFVHDVLK